MATLAAPAALLSGCVINLDGASPGSSMGSDDSGMGSDDSGTGMSTSPGHRLPPPDIRVTVVVALAADAETAAGGQAEAVRPGAVCIRARGAVTCTGVAHGWVTCDSVARGAVPCGLSTRSCARA